jgi:hypothetical protein
MTVKLQNNTSVEFLESCKTARNWTPKASHLPRKAAQVCSVLAAKIAGVGGLALALPDKPSIVLGRLEWTPAGESRAGGIAVRASAGQPATPRRARVDL